MGTNEDPAELMSATSLKDKAELRARLLYVYDFLNLRIFYVETIDTYKAEKSVKYPRVILAYGEMPEMESGFDLESLLEGIESDESKQSQDELDDDQDVWDESGDAMDNIDDYEDLL